MGNGNHCHRGSTFASSERGQTLTGLELQGYKISMNDGKFNEATCEKTSRIAKARKWSEIDWKTAYNYVNRLQIRIVKATEKKDWNLIKRLQHLLTNSFYAKALAIKKVTSNRGKNTAGVDNEIWNSDEKKWNALKQLELKGYKALPTKRVYIPKSNGKKNAHFQFQP